MAKKKGLNEQLKVAKNATKLANNIIKNRYGIKTKIGNNKMPNEVIDAKINQSIYREYTQDIDKILKYVNKKAPKQIYSRKSENFRTEASKNRISKNAGETFKQEEKVKKEFRDLPDKATFDAMSDDERKRAFLRKEEFMKSHKIEGNGVTGKAALETAKQEKIRTDFLNSKKVPKAIKDYIRKSGLDIIDDIVDMFAESRATVGKSKYEYYSLALNEFYSDDARKNEIKKSIEDGTIKPLDKRKGKIRSFNTQNEDNMLANLVSFQIKRHGNKDLYLNKALKIKNSKGKQVLNYDYFDSYYDSIS